MKNVTPGEQPEIIIGYVSNDGIAAIWELIERGRILLEARETTPAPTQTPQPAKGK
jgi:hypothetical protein